LKTGDLYVFTGLLLLLQTLWFVQKPHAEKQIKILLFLGALCIKVGFFHYCPFMQLWDEQFHALVAKNMVHNPFHPQLYNNPLLPYDYTNWSSNSTWLHKQPWFLWQMALSIHVFGNNLWGVRIPSLLMSSLMPVLIFSLGKRVFNFRAALFGGLFAATGFFLTWLAVGLKATDHNDVAFVFYVTASLWALARYTEQPQLKKALLVGLLVGISVLNKWLTGLFAFSVWGLWLLFDGHSRQQQRLWLHLLAAVLLAVMVFLPWQLYVLHAFPVEAQFEMAFNSRHFFEVLEGHDGPWHYHFSRLGYLYGLQELLGGWFVMGPSLVALAIVGKRNPQLAGPWALGVLFVYLFFSAAATKMPAFPYLTNAFWMLAVGALLAQLYGWVQHIKRARQIGLVLLAVGLLFNTSFFDFNRVRNLSNNPYFEGRLYNHAILQQLDTLLPEGERWIVFNTASWEGTLAMFYSNRGVVVYDNQPTLEQIAALTAKGHRIAVFVTPDLAATVLEHPSVFLLDVGLTKHSFF
jgi:4-amino-4-deoxy-L-arabinose transferase-like glycosyltransferase